MLWKQSGHVSSPLKAMPVNAFRVEASRLPAKVREIFIAVTDSGAGEEIYTFAGPGGETIPVVALNAEARAILIEYCQGIANRSGKKVAIIGFTRGIVHDMVSPLTTGDQ